MHRLDQEPDRSVQDPVLLKINDLPPVKARQVEIRNAAVPQPGATEGEKVESAVWTEDAIK